ncbi:NAD(P)-dependent dehydrogenase (short-subunit alcohol dehydrogenase family) [Nocardioides albertanoniae]|uniref:NAD(P)-dependent dehydrogenase (Short-subunit alcohol dehydrogenase family) n=1 Tax=Nocardioides albertanoniae TaxID=1175486 RepID=A0A543A1J7_9ACTN|nr:SDR family oxidoreductase [Nocardioides albertanoniae]TQL66465.1 NAD(P)-dependent dehydrogenase (short-subunit alcohol dehydrogenase family) [Nocardioides albertanoniae]
MAVEIDFSGKVVAVTGGARGVGAGIVARFLEAGAEVEICGRNAPDELPVVDGRKPVFSQVDVREPEQVAAWIGAIIERHGRLDVVVNNAGGAPYADFAAASPRFHEKISAINFLATAYVCQAAYEALKVSQGSIVNISSISARRPSPGTAIYGAAKAAVESLTGSLAVEWAPDVRINAVSCGIVATPGSEDHYGSPEQRAAVAATIPRGVFATPAEIGDACLLLASPLATHITGAVLDVDGGGEWPAFLQHTPNS